MASGWPGIATPESIEIHGLHLPAGACGKTVRFHIICRAGLQGWWQTRNGPTDAAKARGGRIVPEIITTHAADADCTQESSCR